MEYLRQVWKNLREGYFRCKKNRAKASKSGSKATRLPTSNHFEQLKFLDDRTEESLSSPVTNIEDQMMDEPETAPKVSYRENFSNYKKHQKQQKKRQY